MDKKRVLIITQEMQPYLNGTDIGDIARELPQYVQDKGNEIRVLMPCSACANSGGETNAATKPTANATTRRSFQ